MAELLLTIFPSKFKKHGQCNIGKVVMYCFLFHRLLFNNFFVLRNYVELMTNRLFSNDAQEPSSIEWSRGPNSLLPRQWRIGCRAIYVLHEKIGCQNAWLYNNKNLVTPLEKRYRRDGVVVRASASQSVDLQFIS